MFTDKNIPTIKSKTRGTTVLGGILLLLLIFASSCVPIRSEADNGSNGTVPNPPIEALDNTQWLLDSFGEGETIQYSADETPVTALFADGQMGGKSGCNSYSTTYSVQNGELELSAIVSTRMACMGAGGEVEQAYLDALSSATAYSITGDQLVIAYDGGELTFDRQ